MLKTDGSDFFWCKSILNFINYIDKKSLILALQN